MFPLFTVQAQPDSGQVYIKTYDEHLIPKLFANYRRLGLTLRAQNDRQRQIDYHPNVVGTVGVGLVFKRIAINVGFKGAQQETQNLTRGESRYFDLQINRFGRKLGFDAYYQDYAGYFLASPGKTYGTNWTSPIYPQRPDLELSNASLNVYWVFNSERFSYRAAFVHDERQLKSAGSFILTGSVSYLETFADSSLVPTALQPVFGPGFDRGNFINFALVPGYAHTFVLGKRFYFNISASASLGLQHRHFALKEQTTTRSFAPVPRFIGRAALGYNGDRFFGALTAYNDTQTTRLPELLLDSNVVSFSLMIGYRLETRLLKGRQLFSKPEKI
ncbi:MAG: DUF4421 domain-containing protein [Bernardetiaceae bacterium]|nr:DUF4421 domain-containing protein [Bernardetiaceae bacterium]